MRLIQVIDNAVLAFNRRKPLQGGVQTAGHFPVVGFSVAIQIIGNKTPLHGYDPFSLAAGRNLFGMRNQDISGVLNYFSSQPGP